jgi:hypothetical protein
VGVVSVVVAVDSLVVVGSVVSVVVGSLLLVSDVVELVDSVVVVAVLSLLSPPLSLAITTTAISRPTITAVRPATRRRNRRCSGVGPPAGPPGPMIRVGSSFTKG